MRFDLPAQGFERWTQMRFVQQHGGASRQCELESAHDALLEAEQSRVVLDLSMLDIAIRAASPCRWLTMMFLSSASGIGTMTEGMHRRHAQKACRDTVQPSIAERSGQAFIGAPVFGLAIERSASSTRRSSGQVVTNQHGVVGQEASVFDMHELLEHAERRAGRALGDRTPPRIPPAIVMQPEPTIEALRVVRARQAPHPHQAGAPQELRAMRFSTMRAPASVRMSSMGVRPPKLFKFL